MFLKGTYYGVTAFDGDLWPNRFLGFILGIISYAWLTNYFFKQPVTGKILVQLILCFLIYYKCFYSKFQSVLLPLDSQ